MASDLKRMDSRTAISQHGPRRDGQLVLYTIFEAIWDVPRYCDVRWNHVGDKSEYADNPIFADFIGQNMARIADPAGRRQAGPAVAKVVKECVRINSLVRSGAWTERLIRDVLHCPQNQRRVAVPDEVSESPGAIIKKCGNARLAINRRRNPPFPHDASASTKEPLNRRALRSG